MKHFSIEDEHMKCDGIDIRYIEYSCDEPEHSHDAIELAYIVSGNGEHVVNNKTLKAQRGLLIMIDYNCVHSFRIWKNMKYYNLLIKASFLSETLNKEAGLGELMKKYYKYDLKDGFIYTEFNDSITAQYIEDLFFNILSERLQKKKRYTELMRCHVDEIVNMMLRNVDDKQNGVIDSVMAEAIEYISDNCNSGLRLEDVAEKFNYNPRYFSNKLKEYCGLSFKQLILSKRLSNVISDLWNTEDTIDEIIWRWGFTNKTYFYELFEKNYGVKPKFVREYRKNYNKYLEIKTTHKNLLN